MIKKLFIGSTNIDFLQVGKLFYRIFVVEAIIFISVIVLSLAGILNVNLSVDFTGGTTYQLETPYTTDDIDEVMESTILDVSRYQTFENSNSIIFRATENTQDKETEFLFYLANKFDLPDENIDFQRVGPTFGDEITSKGLQALIIFLTLVVLLISYRYEFKYSLIALIALTHDPKIDDPALQHALNKKFYYIGALGSKKTHANRCERLKEAGFSDEQINSIHGPIGIKLGGKSAPEIALSIIAQLVSETYKR